MYDCLKMIIVFSNAVITRNINILCYLCLQDLKQILKSVIVDLLNKHKKGGYSILSQGENNNMDTWITPNIIMINKVLRLLIAATLLLILIVVVFPWTLGVCDDVSAIFECYSDKKLNVLLLSLIALVVYCWLVFYYVKNTKLMINGSQVTLYDRGKHFKTDCSQIKLGLNNKILITKVISIPIQLSESNNQKNHLYDDKIYNEAILPLLKNIEKINSFKAYIILIRQLNPIVFLIPLLFIISIILGVQ